MKRLVILTVLFVTTTAFASGYLQKDSAQNYVIQGFAPDGKLNQSLTGTRTAVDLRSVAAWGISPTADCIYKNQSTATRAGASLPLAANTYTIRIVNSSTPFANFSCAGVLQKQ